MAMTLTKNVGSLIQDWIETGQYDDANAVMVDALRLLEERKTGDLRAKLQTGIDQLDRGESILATPTWSAERLEVMRKRAETRGTPHPDIWPVHP